MIEQAAGTGSGAGIRKARTGIDGLDEITGGGLPAGRPTLVSGAAGCGKTLLAMEFLVRGATEFGEPGVFMAFEETTQELTDNVRSLGFDLAQLEAEGKIHLDYVHIERSEIEETGEYDLEGLFIRLAYAASRIGAKRVVLDTLEVLFAGLPDEAVLRSELRRLFRWLKEQGLTAIVTAERGDGTLTRHGLEEYVADCVILLDHRVTDQMSTRRLRIVKYRGSSHGTNEYPFLISDRGISVLPITSLGLNHEVSTERVSTGIARLDEMLGGQGFYRGSSVLVSGSAGTGKSSLAAHFADAACRRGERCLYFAYEEAPRQITRNMRSIGIDLEPWVDQGLLRIDASRPSLHGLEAHLVAIHGEVERLQPEVVVVDPLTAFGSEYQQADLQPTLMRLVDLFKARNITAVFTSLVHGDTEVEASEVGVSSLMDVWLLLRNRDANGERTRTFHVLKSRGMAHSSQVREFVITDRGVDLVDVYLGAGEVLTGTARTVQEAAERAQAVVRAQEQASRQRQAERRRKALEAQIAALQADLAAEDEALRQVTAEDSARQTMMEEERRALAERRGRHSSDGLGTDDEQ